MRPLRRMRQWFRSWYFYWRAVYKMRTKDHGVHAQPWHLCFAMGRAYRHIIYRQHYMKRPT